MREALAAFDRYLELESSERGRMLLQLEAERPLIAADVKELLANDAAKDDLLEQPAINLLAGRLQHTLAEPPGTEKTGYKVVERLPRIFVWFLWLTLAVCVFLYGWSISLFLHFGNNTDEGAWVAMFSRSSVVITSVAPGGSADGRLMVGDQITGFNGRSESLVPGMFWLRSVVHRGEYEIDGVRGGHAFSVVLPFRTRRAENQFVDQLFFWSVSAFFVIAGLAIGLLKPTLAVARMAAIALVAEGLVLLGNSVGQYQELVSPFGASLVVLLALISPMHFAMAYHFYAAFFDDLRQVKKVRPAIPLLYAGGAVSVFILQAALRPARWNVLWTRPGLVTKLVLFRHTFFVVAPLCICVLLLWNYFRSRERAGQDRAKWIVFGSFFGICPYACYKLAQWLFLVTGVTLPQEQLNLVFHLSIVASIAVPVCAAYSVLKLKSFDIVIQRSLRYILLTRVLQLLLLLPLCGILISLARNRDQKIEDVVGHNLGFVLLLIFVCGMLMFRSRLQRLIDRRYGRDAGARALSVLTAGAEIRRSRSPEQLADTAAEQLTTVLDMATVILMLDETGQGRYRPAGTSPGVELDLEAGTPLLHHLEEAGGPRRLAELPAELLLSREVHAMSGHGVTLASPLLTSKGLLTGLMLLGEREPLDALGKDDRHLIRSFSDDISKTYEGMVLDRSLREQRTIRNDAERRLAAERATFVQECPVCGLCFDYPQETCSRDGESLRRNRAIGRTIQEHYQLDRRIEEGGYGAVYEATDLKLNRTVAIKVIAPPLGVDAAKWLERASREGQALAKLNHPNIVTAYDFGINEQGSAYLVMEFLRGRTLREVITGARIPPALAAAWFDQILDGLEAAHCAGIVHRDLKPENVMVLDTQTSTLVKVFDFGIAKLLSGQENGKRLTAMGLNPGTPLYMSPEQFAGEALDERSDLFSIAVMIVEVLTGEMPFSNPSPRDRFVAWLHGKGSLPGSTESDLLLNNVLQSCLAAAAEQRPRSAAELRRDVVPLVRVYRGREV